MGLRLADRWIWDFWTVRDGNDHHLFYLQAPRSLGDPDRRHWHVSIGHAVSSDLRHWQVLPDALAPAPPGAWDDYTTWTGSVISHDDRWCMYYTGTSRRDGGRIQRIGLATSNDLITWHRHGTEPLIEADPTWYEQLDPAMWPEQAWRDPWVFQHPTTNRFHALITARARDGDPATRGVIGHATSEDLLTWRVQPPLTEPGVFGHLEIPQLEHIGAGWWLLFSTPTAAPEASAKIPGSEAEGTHALWAADPTGPYHWSTYRPLDADPAGTRYGGKLIHHDEGWHLLAWRHRDSDGRFVGELADPLPVRVDRTGLTVSRCVMLEGTPSADDP